MAKVTPQDVQTFNEKYYACHNYAQVARETGFSASTVRKYVQKDWVPPVIEDRIEFCDEMFTSYAIQFQNSSNFGELCELSEEEEQEIAELWKEMSI